MSPITITYCSERSGMGGPAAIRETDGTSCYGFSPCFEARQGTEVLLRTWVTLTHYAATLAENRLRAASGNDADPAAALNQLLIRYGARRIEASVRELQDSGSRPDSDTDSWRLTPDDLDELFLLLPMIDNKNCYYQKQSGRDLTCTAAAPGDKTAAQAWNGRPVAPTSRAICRSCALPESDVLCTNLLYPSVNGNQFASGLIRRTVLSALCDRGKENVRDVSDCQAGGHACWERHVAAESAAAAPVSPLGLPEQFDVLDAYWRLTFGKKFHLVNLTTVTAPASLALPCHSRTEFESRLSALADIIDKLSVDDELLPTMSKKEKADKTKGSLDAFQNALEYKLPSQHHANIRRTVRYLRVVRQARNLLQHGVTRDGGLIAKLRELGVHDAPPNWEGAWNAIRAQTADALNLLRNELRGALDEATRYDR
jgi:hypothetical protein